MGALWNLCADALVGAEEMGGEAFGVACVAAVEVFSAGF
jgi:hypothetical protein